MRPSCNDIAADSSETRSYSSTDRSTASTCSRIFAELLATLSIVDAIRRRRTLSTSSSTLLPISKSNTIVTSSLTIALESRLIVDSSPASIRNGVLRTRPALPLSRNRNDQRSVSLETGQLFPRSSSLPVAQTSLKTISSRLSPMDSSYRLELTIASSPRISCQLSSNSTKLLLLDGLRILSTKSISISKVPRSSQRFVGCFLEFLIGTCFSNGQKSMQRCDEQLPIYLISESAELTSNLATLDDSEGDLSILRSCSSDCQMVTRDQTYGRQLVDEDHRSRRWKRSC